MCRFMVLQRETFWSGEGENGERVSHPSCRSREELCSPCPCRTGLSPSEGHHPGGTGKVYAGTHRRVGQNEALSIFLGLSQSFCAVFSGLLIN